MKIPNSKLHTPGGGHFALLVLVGAEIRRGRFWASVTALSLVMSIPLPAATNPISADDIPPLRPLRAEMPPTFWEQYGLWVALGAVSFFVLAAGVVWWLLRAKPPVAVPPAIQARHELEPLSQQPEDGALLSRVSQVLRHYVAAAFGLPPGELTTTEFCRTLAGAEQVGGELSADVSDFLHQCDQRKFAPAPPLPPLGAVPRAMRLIEIAEARRAALAQTPDHAGAASDSTSPPPVILKGS